MWSVGKYANTYYLRVQLIISIQLDFTTDSLPPDPTNTYLRPILRWMYIGSTL